MIQIYLGKKPDKQLEKLHKRDLKKELNLYISFDEIYDGDLNIILYKIEKEKDEDGEKVITKKKLISQDMVTMKSKNTIYHIPEDILEDLEKGEYIYEIHSDSEMGEYRFKVVSGFFFLFWLFPLLLLILLLLLLLPKKEEIQDTVRTLIDVDGEAKSDRTKDTLSEKEALIKEIQGYQRFIVSSAITVDGTKETPFEISNPERTTFKSEKSLKEMNEILEGELKIYETGRENIYEYDTINSIQAILKDKDENEYYISPEILPSQFIDTVKLTKAIPDNVDNIYAYINVYNPDKEYLSSFQFTIQVNH